MYCLVDCTTAGQQWSVGCNTICSSHAGGVTRRCCQAQSWRTRCQRIPAKHSVLLQSNKEMHCKATKQQHDNSAHVVLLTSKQTERQRK